MAAALETVAGRLKPLVPRHPLIRPVLEVFSNRERHRDVSDIRRLKQDLRDEKGIPADTAALEEVMALFEQTGAGKLKKARGSGSISRFNWNLNSIDVARAALGLPARTEVDPKPAKELLRLVQSAQPGVFQQPPANFVRVSYPLRGSVLTFDVPHDLSKAEAQEIGDFIARFGK